MAACPSSVLLALTLLALCGCPAPHGATAVPPPPPCRCSSLYLEGDRAPADRVSGNIAVHWLMRLRGGRYRQRDTVRQPHGVQPQQAGKRGGPTTAAHGNAGELNGGSKAGSDKVSALKEALRARLGARREQPQISGARREQPQASVAAPPEGADARAEEGRGTDKKKHRPGSFQALGLDNTLLRGMYHAGYKFPTPVQRKVIPHVLAGSHVVAMARTGSGKTAAFLAPMIQRLVVLTAKDRSAGKVLGVQGLVLLPTRELALQAFTFFKTYAKFTPISACLLAGGESIDAQFFALAANPEVVIATPGRLLQLLNEVSTLSLQGVRIVVSYSLTLKLNTLHPTPKF